MLCPAQVKVLAVAISLGLSTSGPSVSGQQMVFPGYVHYPRTFLIAFPSSDHVTP